MRYIIIFFILLFAVLSAYKLIDLGVALICTSILGADLGILIAYENNRGE